MQYIALECLLFWYFGAVTPDPLTTHHTKTAHAPVSTRTPHT